MLVRYWKAPIRSPDLRLSYGWFFAGKYDRFIRFTRAKDAPDVSKKRDPSIGNSIERQLVMKDIAQAVDKPMVETASREDRIQEIAYRRYLARGDDGGDPATDWIEAEAEVDADDARQ